MNKGTYTHSTQPWLCGDNLFTPVRRPWRSLSSQSLGRYWNL